MKTTKKCKDIKCETFPSVISTLAHYMRKSDDRLEPSDNPMTLCLGWRLPSGTRVEIFVGKVKEYIASLDSTTRALCQMALESDEGRNALAQAMFAAARREKFLLKELKSKKGRKRLVSSILSKHQTRKSK